ncbi:hypothetical protein [Serratia odorifera]|uniref:hypothetical protein n=1 Tax=Serratia odorifera TaxID=618 RepID=UPI00236221C2|nr:hypothetical protein [Serratia odorifera]
MALNINAAKLYNRVIYTTDKPSLAKVKKEMDELKKSIQKTTKSASLVNAQADIANAKRVTKAVKEEVAKQQKAYKITMPKSGSGRGTGMVGTATYNAKDSATVARQTAAMYNNRAAAEKALAAQQTKQLAAAAKRRKDALNRDLKATMALRKAAFDINRLQGQSGAERYKSIQSARDITKAFREGRIELSEMNEQMRQLRANAGAAARNARKISRHSGRPTRGGNSQYLLGLGLVSTGAAAAAGAAYGTYRNLDTASTRGHQLKQIQEQTGVSPNQVAAMVQWSNKNGLPTSIERVQDQLKDTQENIGDFTANAKRNKDGEWVGGGRLTEAANQLQLTKSDIQKFENKPVELMNMIVNRGQQLSLTETQIKHLLENNANDGMYMYKMFLQDGKGLIDTMQSRNAAGVSYSTGDLEALDNMYEFNFALKQGAEALQNRFVVGMARSITGTEDLDQAFKVLRPQVEQLGSAMGTLFNAITKLIDWLPTTKVNQLQQQLKTGGVTMATGQTIRSDGSWRDWIPAPIQDALGMGVNAVSPSNLFSRENMVMAGMGLGYANPAQQVVFSPQLAVSPNITVTPDSNGFSSLIDARADAAIVQYERNTVLNTMATTSNSHN